MWVLIQIVIGLTYARLRSGITVYPVLLLAALDGSRQGVASIDMNIVTSVCGIAVKQYGRLVYSVNGAISRNMFCRAAEPCEGGE